MTLNDNSLFVTLLDWCNLITAPDVHQNYWRKYSTPQYLRHSFLLHLCPRLHKWGSRERIPREPTILMLYSFAKPPLVAFIDPYWLMQIITKLQVWVEETARGNLESYYQLSVLQQQQHMADTDTTPPEFCQWCCPLNTLKDFVKKIFP